MYPEIQFRASLLEVVHSAEEIGPGLQRRGLRGEVCGFKISKQFFAYL